MNERMPITVLKRPVAAPDSWSQESYWIDSDSDPWHTNTSDEMRHSGEEQWLDRGAHTSWAKNINTKALSTPRNDSPDGSKA